MPVFTVLVKDTKPVWFYCATAKHCQAGMSGVINPPASTERTLALYKESSKNVATTGIPLSAAGTGGGNNSNNNNTSAAPPPPSDNNLPGEPDPNSGSVLGASSALAFIAAAVVAALAL